ncbi:MAG TPA: CsgG/HfaB family protein [Acidiferrobacterales bacterium]|jgi:curli biogenesis system outer membrane secretion channel CsgG
MTAIPRQAIALPAVLAALFLLGACAPTARVTQGEQGATIAAAQAESAFGPKARITVGRIVNRSGETGAKSLRAQIDFLRRRDRSFESVSVANVTGGIRDMLTTALFNSNRFIVLEREAIGDALVEQEFSSEGRVGDASRIPMGELEGAELLVIGALTAFDAGASGGGLPIPIPLNRRGDLAILNLAFNRSYIAMDLRVIDVATSRIVATLAVEGDATKFGAAVSGYVRSSGGGSIRLPVLLSGFSNTPVEKAISEMVDAAVGHLVGKTPAVYFRPEPDG